MHMAWEIPGETHRRWRSYQRFRCCELAKTGNCLDFCNARLPCRWKACFTTSCWHVGRTFPYLKNCFVHTWYSHIQTAQHTVPYLQTSPDQYCKNMHLYTMSFPSLLAVWKPSLSGARIQQEDRSDLTCQDMRININDARVQAIVSPCTISLFARSHKLPS